MTPACFLPRLCGDSSLWRRGRGAATLWGKGTQRCGRTDPTQGLEPRSAAAMLAWLTQAVQLDCAVCVRRKQSVQLDCAVRVCGLCAQ
eukprot:6970989-Heterocapsa_arctica.AAC.1